MRIDKETGSLLGWNKIKQRLADFARTPQGGKLCLNLTPTDDAQRIQVAQERYRRFVQLVDQGHRPPVERIEEVDGALLRAEKGGVLSPEAILDVACAMEVSSRLRLYLLSKGEKAGPSLLLMAQSSYDLKDFALGLSGSFEKDGRLRDSASVELMDLRRQVQRLFDGLHRCLEKMLKSHRIAQSLSEPYVTLRAERFVLPVRSDSRGEIDGIVHATSQSGATLFIEPSQVVADGNRLKISQAAAQEEEHRILATFSREIAGHASELRDNIHMLAQCDLLLASVEFGQKIKGRLVEFVDHGFDLVRVRHPLMVIQGNPVVDNDIKLSGKCKALVITGPNAGGKTVVLKTLGLSCLMSQAGLPVACSEGSKLGVFSSVAAVIGDSQDISRGLSTFSAHMERIVQLLSTAVSGSLVLLDELAADTDPTQGAALAAAIMERFVCQGSLVLATTHYEELKQLPFQNDAFANAAVGFDVSNMEPTFRLHPGVPGRSLTLDIARRLGLDESIIHLAARRLSNTEQHLDRLLANLEDERQTLAVLRKELEEALSQARQTSQEHRQAALEFNQRQQELLEQGEHDFLAEVASARRKVARLIESLQHAANMQQAVSASQQLIELQKSLPINAPGHATAKRPAESPDPVCFAVGDRVRLLRFDKLGSISSLDRAGQMVTVQLGAIRTRVPVDQIQRVEPRSKHNKRTVAKTQPSKNKTQAHTPSASIEVRSGQNTLDLRGHRVDEALDRIDKFLDQLLVNHQHCAFIIHGHGTGALKSAIREYLRSSPYQRCFRSGRNEEGGDGITVVSLP
jgi:DNA mismatch repair protein MutS2